MRRLPPISLSVFEGEKKVNGGIPNISTLVSGSVWGYSLHISTLVSDGGNEVDEDSPFIFPAISDRGMKLNRGISPNISS